MITSIEIKNFKSIKSLSFDLPKFAVLVGPNGSGKTNIVQAMELFGEILRRGTTDPVRERGGWEQLIRLGKRPARGGMTLGATIPLLESKEPGLFSARMTIEKSSPSEAPRVTAEEVIAATPQSRIRIAVDSAGWRFDVGTDKRLWTLLGVHSLGVSPSRAAAEKAFRASYGADGQGEHTDATVLRLLNRIRFPMGWLHVLTLKAWVSRFRLDTSVLRGAAYFQDPAIDFIGPSGEGLAAAVDRLRGRGKEPAAAFKRVLSALQEVYPRIEEVRTAPIRPGRLTLLFRERGIAEDLGQSNISDGVLHALALLVMLEGGKDSHGILAIEEPENAIHPWSVRAMLERAQVSSRQILLTTHSETVVNAVKDPGSLLIVENDDRKGTIVTPARNREAALDTILAESGQKLGDVWMDGSLGGVPGQ